MLPAHHFGITNLMVNIKLAFFYRMHLFFPSPRETDRGGALKARGVLKKICRNYDDSCEIVAHSFLFLQNSKT